MADALGPEWDVIPEGHPGRTAVFDDPVEGAHKNALRSLQAILESHRPLDMVIVMLGTNDLKARFNTSAFDVTMGVERVAKEISRSECGPNGDAPEVLIVAPISVREAGVFSETFYGAAAKSAELPGFLLKAAQRQGARFVDANDFAAVDSVDGIHLDANAHAAIGQELARVILETAQ